MSFCCIKRSMPQLSFIRWIVVLCRSIRDHDEYAYTRETRSNSLSRHAKRESIFIRIWRIVSFVSTRILFSFALPDAVRDVDAVVVNYSILWDTFDAIQYAAVIAITISQPITFNDKHV